MSPLWNVLIRSWRTPLFPVGGQAIQEAVEKKLARLDRGRLARECAKLDPVFEKALAEEACQRMFRASDEEPAEKTWGKISQIRTLAVEESGQRRG